MANKARAPRYRSPPVLNFSLQCVTTHPIARCASTRSCSAHSTTLPIPWRVAVRFASTDGSLPASPGLKTLRSGDKRPRAVLRSWWPGCRMQCTRQSHGASHRGKRGSPHCLHTRSARQEHLRLCIAMYAAGNIFLLPPYLNICQS